MNCVTPSILLFSRRKNQFAKFPQKYLDWLYSKRFAYQIHIGQLLLSPWGWWSRLDERFQLYEVRYAKCPHKPPQGSYATPKKERREHNPLFFSFPARENDTSVCGLKAGKCRTNIKFFCWLMRSDTCDNFLFWMLLWGAYKYLLLPHIAILTP